MSVLTGDKVTTEFDRLTYNLSYWDWLFLSELTKTKEKQKSRFNLRYRVSGTITGYLETVSEQYNEADPVAINKVGADYTTLSHAFRCERIISDTESAWNASYRYKRKDNVWQGSASVRIPDEGDGIFIASLTWRPTDNIATSIRKHDENESAFASWSDVYSYSPGPKTWDEFAHGTLSGKVLLPSVEGQPMASMAGIEVKAGSKKGITDETGLYVITGLPVEQRIEVTINPSSLDIGLVPEKEVAVIRFRSGTHIEYNPNFISSVGLDGYVDLKGQVVDDISIDIIRILDRKVVKTVQVESDGFFVIERLRPETYELVVKGAPTPFPPKTLELRPGDIWKSEIVIKNETEKEVAPFD